ncbi:response regulator transcription factor [Streptomyces beijiangensis]|uniref:Response regulator transcription factor n=1 Tax=Streptomyces beijiangensis TaxID=163361 RepID=A0A939JHN8_9ACTN|nr:response regulator transcription factor [Streptomyces beijiangensis]MBO0512822.1 response regulator transcription factor [Streptomyces beijiangensis]
MVDDVEACARILAAALHSVAAGNQLFAPAVARRLMEADPYKDAGGDRPLPDLSRLTPRELEILRLVATGADNCAIAGLLTVSEATVKSHLSRAMTKLGVCSRAQAVVMAYETGLVVPRHCRTDH